MEQLEKMKITQKKQQNNYEKYVNYCVSLNKTPKSWYDWTYCTYSGFSESWRLHH